MRFTKFDGNFGTISYKVFFYANIKWFLTGTQNTPHQNRCGVFSSLRNLRHRFFFFAHRCAQLQSGKDYYPNRQYRFEQIQSFNQLCADADNAHIPKQYIHTFSFTPLYQIFRKHSAVWQPTPRGRRTECFRPARWRSATSVRLWQPVKLF